MIEPYISGRELSAGVLGNAVHDVLPICEFLFPDEDPLRRFRAFENKWLAGQEHMVSPTELPPDTTSQVQKYASMAHRALRCRDYSRADFRIDANGHVWFLEHNYNPGIGPNSHGLSNTLTRMFELRGQSFGDLLEAILNAAAQRYGS
jgi:D-alanine-D-alanine ligase